MAGKDFLDFIANDRAADKAPEVKESRVVSALSTPYQQEAGIEAPADTREYINMATKHSVIYRCVDRITRTIAGLPLKVYTEKGGKREQAAPDDKVRLLFDRPNAHEPRYTFYWKISQALETGGVAPIEIVRQGKTPLEMYVLHPAAVRVLPDKFKYIKGYLYKPGGASVEYPLSPDQMLYMKYPNPNSEYEPLSPLSAAKDDIILDLNALAYNKALFKNRAIPAYALKTEQELEAVHIRRLKKEVAQLFGGAGKAGKTMVLEKGLEWQKIQLTPDEVQWLEGRKMTREDICAVYGVPPVIAGIYDAPGANYANSREQEDLFWKLCIKPRLDFIEDYFNYTLLPSFTEGYMVEFLTNDILRVNPIDRNTIYKDALMNARMTPNEIRALENLPKVAGGDTLFIPMNLIPLEMATGGMPAEPEPAKAIENNMLGAYLPAGMKKRSALVATVKRNRERALAPIAKEFTRKWLKELQADQTAIVRALRSGKAKSKAAPDIENLFDRFADVFATDRQAAYASMSREYVKQSMGAGAEYAAGITKVRFDMESARAMELIKTQCTILANGTSITMGTAVKNQLRAGLEKGEDIHDLADRISQFYDGMKAGKAEEVARTETCLAYSTGSVEDYRQAGITEKEWYFDGSEETCPDGSCAAAADMGVIGIDEDFGEAGECPPAHPNCTCAVLPVIPGG